MKTTPIPVPESPQFILPNKTRFYPLRRGTVNALKLEFCFDAGRPFESDPGLASATLQLIKSGTKQRSATKLAEGLDYWGSSLNCDFYIDTVGIKLFVLEKYLPKVMPYLKEMLQAPTFPPAEINLYKRQQKEKLRSDQSRGDVVAYRAFTEYLFGNHHPYGYNSSIDTIEAITKNKLQDHFNRCYTIPKAKVFLSGAFTESTADFVKEQLLDFRIDSISPNEQSRVKPHTTLGSHQIELKTAVQSSIRIGRRMFTRSHKDYAAAFVLNTILGGYYGSRLMQNLREKRGLTYHIYSTLDTFMLDGYFLISTEVDKERKNLALTEIYSELDLLKNKLIPLKELRTVKNYIRGSFLHYFENAFGYSELVRILSLEGGPKAFTGLLEQIELLDPQTLKSVAQKYFQEKDLVEVQVG